MTGRRSGERPGPGSARLLSRDGTARWDAFVQSAPQGTFFHLAAWRDVLEGTLGHRTYYLFVEQSGEIEGVLPLVHQRSLLFGSGLISLPYCAYGGVVARSAGGHRRLEQAAEELGRKLGVGYLELRNRVRRRADWPRKDLYATFRKELHPRPEENLRAVPRKQRAMVRKGLAAGLSIEIDRDVSRFYEVFSLAQRNLGTPVASREYFRALQMAFGDRCEILTVTRRGRAVSSVMSFYFRDEVLPYFGGGTAEARDLKANDFMYWQLMRRACERGVRFFDFGRSRRGTGAYAYKRHWGFTAAPLVYEYLLLRRNRLPDASPSNRKFRLLTEAWKRLPLPIHRWVGPRIFRHLG